MDQIAEKLRMLAAKLAAQKRPVDFLALLLPGREGDQDQWDIVIAAPWLDSSDRRSWDFIVKRVSAILSTREIEKIAGTIILNRRERGSIRIVGAHASPGEYSDFMFNGVSIQHGIIIVNKSRSILQQAPHRKRGSTLQPT